MHKALAFAVLALGALALDVTAAEFVVDATVFTSRTGGRRLSCGARNDANSREFVALPDPSGLDRAVDLRVIAVEDRNGRMAEIEPIEAFGIPVDDVGPNSKYDPYWTRSDKTPMAARGLSDTYREAKTTAGIDLSLKLCQRLGFSYPWTGRVAWKFSRRDAALLFPPLPRTFFGG